MKTITIHFKTRPSLTLPVKRYFHLLGARWAIHRPAFQYMNADTVTVSKHGWAVSESVSGMTIPLDPQPLTVKTAEHQARYLLKKRFTDVGEEEFTATIKQAQQAAKNN